jgi:hypothetical protein
VWLHAHNLRVRLCIYVYLSSFLCLLVGDTDAAHAHLCACVVRAGALLLFCDAAPCVRPSTASASAACFSCSYHACCRLLLLQVSLLRAYLSPMLSLPALFFVFVPVCGQFVLVACVALLRIECCRSNACVRLCYHVMHPHELSCFVCASADAVQCRASAPGFCPAPVSCACACVDAADTLWLLPCMCSCPVYPCTIAICCGCVNMLSYSAFCVPWTAARACCC